MIFKFLSQKKTKMAHYICTEKNYNLIHKAIPILKCLAQFHNHYKYKIGMYSKVKCPSFCKKKIVQSASKQLIWQERCCMGFFCITLIGFISASMADIRNNKSTSSIYLAQHTKNFPLQKRALAPQTQTSPQKI